MKLEETYLEEGNSISEQVHYGIYTLNEDEENVLWESLEKLYKEADNEISKNIAFEMLKTINNNYGI